MIAIPLISFPSNFFRVSFSSCFLWRFLLAFFGTVFLCVVVTHRSINLHSNSSTIMHHVMSCGSYTLSIKYIKRSTILLVYSLSLQTLLSVAIASYLLYCFSLKRNNNNYIHLVRLLFSDLLWSLNQFVYSFLYLSAHIVVPFSFV